MTERALVPEIDIRSADVGPHFDRCIALLVVVAVLAAWRGNPGNPLAMAGFLALLLVSWGVPRLLNACRRRAAACNPGSLCAQTRVDYLCPEALKVDADGTLFVRWPGDVAFLPVSQLRVLHLGPLLQLALATTPAVPSAATPSDQRVAEQCLYRMSDNSTLEMRHAVPITDGDTRASPDSSTDEGARPLLGRPLPAQVAETGSQHGSCLLWLNRLPPAEAAALRRWLLWRRRGGD